jgi:O-antigen ligase
MSLSLSTDFRIKEKLFWVLGAITAISIWYAIVAEEELILAIPFVLVLGFQTLVNYRPIYFLLFATIPLSTEFYFNNGLSTDLPTEPLIVGLMLVYVLQIISRPDLINGKFWRHPLTLLLLTHFLWIAFSSILSSNQTVSIKFTIAKFWYLAAFFFLTGHIMRDEKQTWKLWWWIVIPLALATLKVILHHASLDFGFKEINRATSPFFRNHVNYAAILALILPMLWFFWGRYRRWTLAWWILAAAIGVLFFGVLTAYTRAAYVALFLAAAMYFVIKLRLIRWALLGAIMVVPLFFGYMIYNNKFMDYAPSERTVSHVEFKEILSATYKLEDVSTSERYYRWIAGIRMSGEHPVCGVGPGNFYFFYKQYTLNRFATYVSDNPEKSGIHNYFLMTLVEQGWPGLLIFLAMMFYTLILGEKVYHESGNNTNRKALVMGLLLLLTVIDAFLLMNDMIETDKVGSFFFFSMAIFINLDLKNKSEYNLTISKKYGNREINK